MAAATLRSAVEGLCDSVQRSTQARTLAEQASQVAESGGHTVHEVMDTMERISASSRKIGDIIGVMDTIAFQTNLLALNAAVVAAEVRNLAQHSAAAAKEIKQLIELSCQQVNCGAEQVRQAGQTMQDIMGASTQVTAIIHEVAEAAVHQSAQLRAVTEALDHRPQELAPPPAVTSMPVFSFAPTPRPGTVPA
ncbi:methyl-accepting chemotaxis protein [Comamonas aquatica]|nr:methyl-accepting chemotaxis protein [Comamonas aquatica]MDH0901251.1 methyl-accepting chemotaxis protein [Comamonas aquatica]